MSGPLDCLFDPALAGLYPMEPDEVNRFLVKWEHKLGPCNRPFRQEGFALMVGAEPIAVAMSASIVHGPVDGYRIQEVVELARMCACERWANRLMLRLWREVAAPKWACWPVKAAVSYSKNSDHNGNLYRFDGWRKVKDDCGSNGGGAWSRKRYASDAVQGPKTLWMWDYPSPTAQPPPPASGIHGEGQPGTPHGTREKCSLADEDLGVKS